MRSTLFKKEKVQTIFFLTALTLIFLTVAYLCFGPSKKNINEVQKEDKFNHNLYVLKEEGTFSKYNTLSKKYISEIKISKDTPVSINEFQNPYKVINYNEGFLATSPSSKEIVAISEEGNELKEKFRLKLEDIPNNIIIHKELLFISYLNSHTLDIFDLNSKEKVETVVVDQDIDALTVDDTNLYISHGNYIEIVNRNLKDKRVKIFTGAKTIALFKSADGYLYATNIFASDSKNSLLIKIDINHNNIANILELEKEYPIAISEKEDELIIVCKGLTDNLLDGVSIIDKDLFSRKTNVSTGNTPNNITFIDNEFAYVSHDDGLVSMIDMREGYQKKYTFNIHGIRALSNK